MAIHINPKPPQFSIRVHRSFEYLGNDIEVRLVDIERKLVVSVVETKVVEPGDSVEPITRLNNTQAQVLMDELWACGIRPTEGSGSAGSMAATTKHLEDMRTLYFHKMSIPK